MKPNQTYFSLKASTWPALIQQVKAAINSYWHFHAGHWQPENISLHIADKMLPDELNQSQREAQLPVLVSWLKLQGHVVTVFNSRELNEHRLYINIPKS